MPPPLPREHGAWAMLAVPLLLGSIAARAVTASSLLVLPAAVLLFLARFAAMGGTRARRGRAVSPERLRWTVLYLAASALCLLAAVALAAPDHRSGAVALAALTGGLGAGNAALVLAGKGRTLLAEPLAMAAVAATAPLVEVLAGAPLDARALGLAVLCLAYFLSTLAFVRAYRALGDAAAGRDAILGCIAVHAGLAAALGLGWRSGWLSGWLMAAFVPVLARTAWGLARPPGSLGALGRRELAVSAVFVAAAGAVLLAGA